MVTSSHSVSDRTDLHHNAAASSVGRRATGTASVKMREMSKSPDAPLCRTSTEKACVAYRPPGSVAVTVTVARPAEMALTVTSAPAAVAVAAPGSEEEAAKVSGSPSGSVK